MVGCMHRKQGRKYWSEKWQESLPLLALSLYLLPIIYIINIIRYFCAEIFTRTCFCDFVANSRKGLFRKIKSRQVHCQNKEPFNLKSWKYHPWNQISDLYSWNTFHGICSFGDPVRKSKFPGNIFSRKYILLIYY